MARMGLMQKAHHAKRGKECKMESFYRNASEGVKELIFGSEGRSETPFC
jgi:hypothetical protein